MSRTLFVHPSPARLRHLAREHLAHAPALTLVPNLAAGRSVRQLTRQALPTTTFAQHAKRALSRAGWRPLGEGERQERLSGLLGRLGLEYFGAILDRSGTPAALAQVIRALLRADASRLPPGRSARERDLVRLHRTWVLELLRDQAFEPGVPEFFASRVALVPERLVGLGFAYLDAAQIGYLDRLAQDGSALYLPAASDGGLSEARRTLEALAARSWTVVELSGPTGASAGRVARIGDRAAQHVLTPQEPAAGILESEVPVLLLPSVAEEVREVLRQVKRARQEEDRPWHELAIVVRDEPTYLGPLTEVAREYGVPLLSQARQPLLATPLGSLLQAWAEAGQRDWPFELTRRVLLHPLLKLPFDPVLQLRGFGRRSPQGLAAWSEEPVALAFGWPEHARGQEYLRHLTAALTGAGVIDQQRVQPHLGLALAALAQALRPLEGLPDTSRAVFLGHLLTALREATVPLLPGKGGVRVMTPLGTLGRSFQAVWVVGLAEGVFPRPASDPPLLDAQVRADWSQTGVYLPGGVESQAIERALFFHALACARVRLTLSRPASLPGGRPAAPSAFLTPFRPGTGVTEVHAGSAHEARVLAACLGSLEDEAVRAAALREDRRERGLDEEPRLPGQVDPDRWTWSASQLHTYGACRYHWFAGRVMNLQPLPQPTEGFGPKEQGVLYHRVLERLLTPFLGEDPPPPDDLARQVPAALDEAVQELAREGELSPGPLWHVECREHAEVLQEAVRSPQFLPGGHRVTALEQPLDGLLQVGEARWAFKGFADRVDRTASGDTVVTDYKLSAYVSQVRDPDGHLTQEVQLPVYLELLHADHGRYYSLKSAKLLQGAWPDGPAEPGAWQNHRRQLAVFLQGLRQDLLAGDFRARPDPATAACTYCDMKPLCRIRTFKPRWTP